MRRLNSRLLNSDQRVVVWALRRLPRRPFEALVLRHRMNLEESEIAETVGISVGTVSSLTSRGMTRLSELLESRVACRTKVTQRHFAAR
ncbi:sigma factor-like helix-turn-helix DNA-binding protein [Streptomyces sp. NPDC019990]|uniref:sigma factor-like helix-turn-helix DNA-binding protein n=1 Tax=Streptomyces sp. NPDC019990 TaxID=3154693 RepID=UPI0033E8918C